MEYVAIPWQNHTKEDREPRQWTVNLGLFVAHILAGNSHCIAWSYPRLTEEELTVLPCRHEETDKTVKTTNRKPTRTNLNRTIFATQGNARGSSSRKRRRVEDPDDEFNSSFTESFQLPSQVRTFSDPTSPLEQSH
jgi:hypothetical protein